jgi:hypothetical protein
MWFKKKITNIFDQLPMLCSHCNKSFPKNVIVCPHCKEELVKTSPRPGRDQQTSVQYGERQGKELSQPVFNTETNSIELHIRDEKYPMRCFPRHHVLHGPLAPLKRYIKNLVIEQLVKCLPYKIPDENLAEPVREIARVFDLLVEVEDEPEMKRLMGQFKDAICMVLQEDDAWRYTVQMFLQKLDMKKMKLSEADIYYFKGKSFDVNKALNIK